MQARARGSLASLWRHPVKGFTPEPVERASLSPGKWFPFDRIYAVEDGDCGFDPLAPAHVPKQRFLVLARLPQLAAIRTRYDPVSRRLSAQAGSQPVLEVNLSQEAGRLDFAAWLTRTLGGAVAGPLRVLEAPDRHRFTDHPKGFVSLINMASLRDLAARLGGDIDPRRLRGNLLIEGWPAWIENEAAGGELRVGDVRAHVLQPITRCAATEVDPLSGRRDLPVPKALFENYRHVLCGIYAEIVEGGEVTAGSSVELA